jgi:hypothetical protein
MPGRHPHQSLKLSIAAICEYALESRGRWTLVGTYRAIDFADFPAVLPRVEVYLLFTDVVNTTFRTAGVNLRKSVRTEDFEAVASLIDVVAPMSKPSFPHAFEAVFRLVDVVIPEPARYDLNIEVDGEAFDLIPIYVRRSR